MCSRSRFELRFTTPRRDALHLIRPTAAPAAVNSADHLACGEGHQRINTCVLPGTRGMSVVMKNRQKKVLLFPKSPEEPAASTIVVQIGSDRFAIHWEIEELPPAAPLLPWKRAGKKATSKIMK